MVLKLRSPLSCSHSLSENSRALLEEIVGADDGRIAPGIAAAEPALLDHRHVRDTVVFGEVIGGCQPVAAAADDDDIVSRLRLGIAPRARPAAVAARRVSQQGPDRVLGRHDGPLGGSIAL